eukprot:Protomagalhaensia_wolfi_Nauph_80__138@NODE_107_length_3688_cov_279_209372_g81_i0_p2_GENE_NODE_107_length_3688_cov_279_209372_g81_i0NODE_107_length_3688_cov_279_209372_g81_i0_p2_ORF_typecomplete_len235_score47_45Asp_Glu_race/PF01177_22/1_1e35_NODE_107_length_3688_cov_279_209372_g81_i021662870
MENFVDRKSCPKIESPKTVLGVLGGMGPLAGAEFARLLADKAPAECDQDHPVVYMLSDPHIPDRTAGIKGLGPDPTERLRQDLKTIEKWGVDYIAVPCNTAHVFIDRFSSELSVPLIHIVTATLEASRERSPSGAWLLATEGTINTGLYQQYAKRMNYRLREIPPELQPTVSNTIALTKANKLREAGKSIRGVIEELWKIEDMVITTACTELPLALYCVRAPRRASRFKSGGIV